MHLASLLIYSACFLFSNRQGATKKFVLLLLRTETNNRNFWHCLFQMLAKYSQSLLRYVHMHVFNFVCLLLFIYLLALQHTFVAK